MSEKSENGNKISVIIPAKNEENNIADIIQKLKEADIHEIIVVDGFSTDRTREFAEKAGAKVLLQSRKVAPGKGVAMKTGVKEATGDIVLFLDADIINFDKKWITQMTDPIIKGETDICKADYERGPTDAPVTKLVAKPMLKMLFPDLEVNMPLEGEISAKKSTFMKLDFVDSWGIDVGLILSAYKQGYKIKNVYLGKKDHKKSYTNDVAELSGMAENVMRTIIEFMDSGQT
ncbi:MAG: glycosyltransferase [Candidatus Woesearchaeota archaeon]|nr:MAG: glycosyltransferase [Candidatus Woesearchaeota archaeon]